MALEINITGDYAPNGLAWFKATGAGQHEVSADGDFRAGIGTSTTAPQGEGHLFARESRYNSTNTKVGTLASGQVLWLRQLRPGTVFRITAEVPLV